MRLRLLPLAQRDFFDQEAEPRFAVVVDAGTNRSVRVRQNGGPLYKLRKGS